MTNLGIRDKKNPGSATLVQTTVVDPSRIRHLFAGPGSVLQNGIMLKKVKRVKK
jgi:hypothetical protein